MLNETQENTNNPTPYEHELLICPAIQEKGVCFAGNNDISCEECKRVYWQDKI